MNRSLALAVTVCLVWTSSSLAETVIESGGAGSITDRSSHSRPMDFSILGWIPWYYGFGLGVEGRFEIPVLPDGFIPQINDEFDIEPSLGLAYSWWPYTGYTYNLIDIAPAVYGIWAFHFSPKFRAYGGLGLGYNIGIVSCPGCGAVPGSFFYWDPVVGLNWKFVPNIALRAEAGAQGLKGGISIYF